MGPEGFHKDFFEGFGAQNNECYSYVNPSSNPHIMGPEGFEPPPTAFSFVITRVRSYLQIL